MFMRITSRNFVRAVPHHYVETAETQERPAIHTEPDGKSKFVEKVALGFLTILDRQNMLGCSYFKHQELPSQVWILITVIGLHVLILDEHTCAFNNII